MKTKKGPLNAITDVAGVTVGHATVDTADHKTGVTVILPAPDDIYRRKMVAACHVLNGYGKTTGLVQIEELGTLESPIALTNTLNVGLVSDAIIEYMEQRAGYAIRSVNTVVGECNDASLNRIALRAVGREEVFRAIEGASREFARGDVGAGKGMTCHGLKGGIGTASRVIAISGKEFTLGVLALTNHGRLPDLVIDGDRIGERIDRCLREDEPDKGSCIMVLATDLPVTSRQLRRVIRRCGVGLARLGSYWGHGSGDIMIGFSTANRIDDSEAIMSFTCVGDASIDAAFRAAAEATEEAVLDSLRSAHAVTGYSGTVRHCLGEFEGRV